MLQAANTFMKQVLVHPSEAALEQSMAGLKTSAGDKPIVATLSCIQLGVPLLIWIGWGSVEHAQHPTPPCWVTVETSYTDDRHFPNTSLTVWASGEFK